MCEAETAYAEDAQENVKGGFNLTTPTKMPKTHFWVDSFDVLEDRQAGGGSVDTTHLVAFQNQCEVTVVNKNLVSIKLKKCQKLFIQGLNI